ncbi:ribonuclease H-like domain-containing protein [Tanacetum coccineum]|uniref:Ribonuclease H-like domain-containing protein n=1 Tax=Tanacetum coccineum TaxID=301880 RepID=A0ABQ4ZIP1_9ASTR
MNKKDERGIVIKNKERLVTQGYTKEEGIDYDEIEEEVYVCQPPGFGDPDFPDRVYKVEKALYGLHQAPRAWYETLSTYLFENSLSDVKIANTPMKTHKPLLKDADGEDVDEHMYRSMIGSLMYLTSSRPDIMFVCKKQTVVANSTTKAKYVAASSCCGQKGIKVNADDSKLMLLGINLLLQEKVNAARHNLLLLVFLATAKVKTVNGEVQLQALVDGKKQLALMGYEKPSQKLTFYKAFFSPQWKFLIHTILQCLSAKTTAWNEFSSTMASANNLLSYKPEIQLFLIFLDKQAGDMSTHDEIFVTPSHIKKVFGNMKRVGKGFSGRVTPLFPTMMKKQSRRKQRKDTKIPQSSGPIEPIADEAANEENVSTQSNDPPLSRVNTLGSEEERMNLKELMDLYTKLSDKVLDLETTETAQAKEIASLKKRVKKLERKRKSKTLRMKRLFKIGRSAQVVSSEDEEVTLVDKTQRRYDDAQMFDTNVFNDEEVFVAEQSEKVVEEVVSTAEVVVKELVQSTITTVPLTIPKAKSITFRDPGESTTRPTLTPIPLNIKDKGKAKMIELEKPLKMKEQIRLDEELAFKLQAEEEEQARLAREKAKEVEEANISWDNVQAMIEADRLLAERLQAREQEELTDEEKARLFVELLEKRKKHFAALRAQEKRNKPPTKAQKKSTMSTYLKHMAGYKQSQLKNKSFAEIQKLFDKAMTRVNMFVDKDTELVKESSKKAEAEMAQESSLKRAGDELEQEKEKKQKIDDDQEEAEMKKLIKVVPDEEEVAIDAIPLATKPPSIVDWKIAKEGKISLFQIIRANGSSKRYSSMIQMLRDFDREDLETLWKLVKAKHGSTRPEEGYERVLWGDLRTMFEHNIEDTVWRNLLGNKVLIWKLFDSCGVHFVRFQDMHLFMLVEKRYPLTPATITEMLNKKLQTDHLNEMCYQLLKLMTK